MGLLVRVVGLLFWAVVGLLSRAVVGLLSRAVVGLPELLSRARSRAIGVS